MSVRMILLLGVLVIMLVAAAGHTAGPAYVVCGCGGASAELQRLELHSGARVPIGNVGYPATHLAFDSTARLFAVDAAGDQLLAVDLSTGVGTPVGPLGVDILDTAGLGFDGGDRLWMTALDELSGPSLFEVDPATGEAAWVAGLSWEHLGSVASDGDTVYVAGRTLAVVDTATGAVSPIPDSTFGIWWARSVDFDAAGTMWSLGLCEVCMAPFDVLYIHTVDTASGTIESFGPSQPHGTSGLAIEPGGLSYDGFESGTIDGWSSTTSRYEATRSVL